MIRGSLVLLSFCLIAAVGNQVVAQTTDAATTGAFSISESAYRAYTFIEGRQVDHRNQTHVGYGGLFHK